MDSGVRRRLTWAAPDVTDRTSLIYNRESIFEGNYVYTYSIAFRGQII